MAEEKTLLTHQAAPQHRPPAEPGHRYQPRRVQAAVSRPVISPAPHRPQPLAAKASPDKTHPKVIDSLVAPAKQKRSAQTLKPALPRQHRSHVLKRQFVDRAAQHSKQAKQQQKLQLKAFVFGGVAALSLAGVLLLAANFNKLPFRQATPQTATLGVADERAAENDIESPILTGAMRQYKVPAAEPKAIRIPKLQIVARVLKVKSNINGDPLTPANIFDTGWLETSAKPGEPDAALITGAVAGPTKAGIFANLGTLAVGDTIVIERGDGSFKTFKVAKSESYPADKVDINAARKSAVAGRPGLNLLTASGKFNVKTNRYEPRTVIFAVQD